jgi:hypothetical protein
MMIRPFAPILSLRNWEALCTSRRISYLNLIRTFELELGNNFSISYETPLGFASGTSRDRAQGVGQSLAYSRHPQEVATAIPESQGKDTQCAGVRTMTVNESIG